MKLEVGMYVRYKNGIGKIVAKYVKGVLLDKGKGGYFRTESVNILKASYNIIDLIERFDIANGHLVICKMYEDEKDIPTIIKCVGDYYFKEEDIKSIVTKEQFESISYRIEDEE